MFGGCKFDIFRSSRKQKVEIWKNGPTGVTGPLLKSHNQWQKTNKTRKAHNVTPNTWRNIRENQNKIKNKGSNANGPIRVFLVHLIGFSHCRVAHQKVVIMDLTSYICKNIEKTQKKQKNYRSHRLPMQNHRENPTKPTKTKDFTEMGGGQGTHHLC